MGRKIDVVNVLEWNKFNLFSSFLNFYCQLFFIVCDKTRFKKICYVEMWLFCSDLMCHWERNFEFVKKKLLMNHICFVSSPQSSALIDLIKLRVQAPLCWDDVKGPASLTAPGNLSIIGMSPSPFGNEKDFVYNICQLNTINRSWLSRLTPIYDT